MANLKLDLSSLQGKARERTVKTQSLEYDLETLVKKIDKGVIKLDPDYQRRHRWDEKTSSRLIESLILNIPIPIIYISQDVDVDSETEEYRYSVIDGQQRLTAMHSFLKNKFSLIELESLEELNGCYYSDLPPFLIRRLEERTVKCLRIDSTIDEQVKLDIFERLNSGSVKLEAQELRNAVYNGKFNKLCKNLSSNKNFRILLQVDLNHPNDNNHVKKMEDVELVLRFFSLINDNYLQYRKKERGFADFLSDTMKLYNAASDSMIDNLKNDFEITMSTIVNYFGQTAFAKYKYENNTFKIQSKFNSAVYDALAVSCHDLIFSQRIKSFTGKDIEFRQLFRNNEFFESISGNPLENSKIRFRIEQTKKAIG